MTERGPIASINPGNVLLVASGAAVVILALFTLPERWLAESRDVAVYWEAGQRLRAGGDALYEPAADPLNTVGYYIYPPSAASLFATLGFLPRLDGYRLWLALNAACLYFAGRSLAALVAVPGVARRRFMVLLGLALSGALVDDFLEGQANLVVLLFAVWGLRAHAEGAFFKGAALVGIASHLKLLPASLLPLLFLSRPGTTDGQQPASGKRRRVLATAGGALSGVLLAAASAYPFTASRLGWSGGIGQVGKLHSDYVSSAVAPRLVSQTASGIGDACAPNNSISAALRRLFVRGTRLRFESPGHGPLLMRVRPRIIRWLALAIPAAMYLAACALAWRVRDSLGALAAQGLGLFAGLLGNLVAWPHHLCLLGIAVSPLIALSLAEPTRRLVLVGALAQLLLTVYAPLFDPSETLQVWGVPTAGLLALWALLFALFWGRARIELLPFAGSAADHPQAVRVPLSAC